MSHPASTQLDMTMMLAFHAGFRRDLERLTRAAEQPDPDRPSVKHGWETFSMLLDGHHHAEDDDLWPVAREHLAGQPDDLLVLDAMEAEHATIDPLIAAVDARLSDQETDDDALAQAVASFRDGVLAHLAHEEKDALPLIDRVVSPEEWKHFSDTQRRKHGLGYAAQLFPWLTDGHTPESEQLQARLPLPVKLLNRWAWQPRYNRTPRW